MKRRPQGTSLYFATDKNIFDALNNRKVDVATVRGMFEERNIIVSSKTSRVELAKYFARLNHDFIDHQRIATRLGIVARRERATAMEVIGIEDADVLEGALNDLKEQQERLGDVVQISRDAQNIAVTIQYDIIDYGKSEFSQVQRRDGTIEFLKSPEGYTIRSTQNDYISGVRDTLLAAIEKAMSASLKRRVVSLSDILEAQLRSKFFDRLMNELIGFKRVDVQVVYVYKPRPGDDEEDDTAETADEEIETHVEKITFRGNGVSRSEMLHQVTRDGYYIFKAVWTLSEVMSAGTVVYEVEAGFEDPKDCTGFYFIVTGVYPVEKGVVGKKKRAPARSEVDLVSRVVERGSQTILANLRQEAAAKANREAA
jgi:hypothetical protein